MNSITKAPVSLLPAWLLLVALLSVGCAATPQKPKPGFVPDQKTGLVVGRGLFVDGGKIITTDQYRNLLSPSMAMHLSPFVSVNELNMNTWVAGKWMFEAAVKEEGYFVGSLPVGKYYFVEFLYFDMVPPTGEMAGIRSYTPLAGSTLFKPFVATFEVLPGKATYIGSMMHLYDAYRYPSRGGAWGFEVNDDFETARTWFAKQYPQLASSLESSLVKLVPTK